MSVSNSFPGKLTRAHLSTLPDGFNPVHGSMVIRLRRKGYSRREAEQIAERCGFSRLRPSDYYERQLEKCMEEGRVFAETGSFSAFSPTEGQLMHKAVAQVPDKAVPFKLLQRLAWFRDGFENLFTHYQGRG